MVISAALPPSVFEKGNSQKVFPCSLLKTIISYNYLLECIIVGM